VQQRFRWVQLRCDQEPVRCILHRQLLRRLAHTYCGVVPLPDNTVYKVLNAKGTGEGLDTCYSATYVSHTHDQQHFTITEVAAHWHEPLVPQHIM